MLSENLKLYSMAVDLLDYLFLYYIHASINIQAIFKVLQKKE